MSHLEHSPYSLNGTYYITVEKLALKAHGDKLCAFLFQLANIIEQLDNKGYSNILLIALFHITKKTNEFKNYSLYHFLVLHH